MGSPGDICRCHPSWWKGGIAVLAVALAGVCTAAEPAAEPDLFPTPVYVTLQGTGAVEALPSGRLCTGLPGAHYDAVSPDGKLLLVSSVNLPQAWLVDASDCRKLASFEVGPVAQGVMFSPDGRYGVAVSAKDGTVSVIDIGARKIIKTIAVGKMPHNAEFTRDGRFLYVTLQGGEGVAVIDPQDWKKVREIPLPGFKAHNLSFTANDKVLWIRGFVGHVEAVDVASGKVLARIPVGPAHSGIDVMPGGRYVFTAAIGGDKVYVIDPQTFKVVKEIEVGAGPHGVRSSRDGKWVYAGVTGTGKLAVISTKTLKVVKQIPLEGKVPFWLSVAPKG